MVLALILLAWLAPAALAGDAAHEAGDPVLDRPTLRCLGAYWVVRGDGNADAQIEVSYRRAGDAASAWRRGHPFFRVRRGSEVGTYGSDVQVPAGAWLFAGSVVGLEPGTAYELRLTLSDPDGGRRAERVLSARTRAEPSRPANMRVLHAVPGDGGGTGTAADPLRGLKAATAAARAGDLVLLGAGTYAEELLIRRSGEEGRPIIFAAADGAEAVIAPKPRDGKRPARAATVSAVHDVWLEGLAFRNADYGIVAHDSARLVIRRCRISGVDYGICATRNTRGDSVDHLITDNVIEGPSAWPRSKGIEAARGIQLTGAGHVVAHNRVRNFADAIDTFPSPVVAAIDIHNNEVSAMTDDGIELDYSHRNVRCFENRLTDVYQGISVQPVHGGPAYVFRNALFNVVVETFKVHNGPSGAVFYHNTSVKAGMPLVLMTDETAHACVSRNNLFVGTSARYAFECNAPMEACDFDFDGFAGDFPQFLKWNGQRYATMADARAKAPVYRNAVRVDAARAFASGARAPEDTKRTHPAPDLRLSAGGGGGGAVDAGQALPGFNDGFAGRGPDLGAYESGRPLPWYGPRKHDGG